MPNVSGIEVIDDLLSDPIKKLAFVSVWFSFAFSLYLLNRLIGHPYFFLQKNLTP
jgi:hypothetical protein